MLYAEIYNCNIVTKYTKLQYLIWAEACYSFWIKKTEPINLAPQNHQNMPFRGHKKSDPSPGGGAHPFRASSPQP